eukprot:tig00020510_g9942.t1
MAYVLNIWSAAPPPVPVLYEDEQRIEESILDDFVERNLELPLELPQLAVHALSVGALLGLPDENREGALDELNAELLNEA